jgi:hypothetical protein
MLISSRIPQHRTEPVYSESFDCIILAMTEGYGTAEIMRRADVSKPCVWRWQERFMREGMAGLLRDKRSQARAVAVAGGGDRARG